MGVTTTNNKPFNPRGNDQSPKGYNRAALYSGKALDFDGVNDYANIDYSDTIGSVWTWSSIIEFDVISGYQVIFGGSNSSSNITIYLKDNQINFYTDGDNLNTAFDFETGEKYHIACSQSGDTISVYVNGQAAGSVSLTATLNSTSNTYTLCKNPASSYQFLNAKISGLKLFNTALTAAQVADLYNNPEKVVPTGVADSALKLYLPMMEGAGTTAYDGSGNGNHGTISGATYVNGIGAPVAQSAVMDWNKGTNRFLQSNSFDTTWTKNNATLTSGQSGYDGSSNAWKLQSNNSSSSYLQQTVSASGVLTASVYAKAGTANFIALYKSSSVNAFFNLSNGSVGTTNGTTSTSIEDVGNGWYRCSMIYNASTSYIQIYLADANGSYSSAVGSNIYIQNAQLESAATAGPFVLTLTTAQSSEVLIPQGLTSGRDLLGNLFENVRKQGALNLDGNSWAEVHDNASLDIGDFSMEAWVRFKKNGNYQVFFAKDDSSSDRSYELGLDVSQTNFFANVFGTGNGYTTSTIEDNVWYHLVSTFDISANDLNHYINGVLNRNFTLSETQSNTDAPLIIGGWYDKTNFLTNGQIAQPRIYNRALTASEIQQNYNAGKNTYTN